MWRQRELAFARQRGLCFYCYCEITLEPNKQNCFVLDHLNPSSRGGGDNTNNRVAACLVCDANKRSRTPLLVETAKQAGLLAPTPSEYKFPRGTPVRKIKGYRYVGLVLGTFDYFPYENVAGEIVERGKFVNVQHGDGHVMHFRENELEEVT